MKKQQCPICYSELQVIELAPCNDCGHLKQEIQHCKEGKHRYNVYTVYHDLTLQLCDFCDVDFGSYSSEYFGFSSNRRIGFEDFEWISEVKQPTIQKGKYCPQYNKGLTFLEFLWDIRERITEEENE